MRVSPLLHRLLVGCLLLSALMTGWLVRGIPLPWTGGASTHVSRMSTVNNNQTTKPLSSDVGVVPSPHTMSYHYSSVVYSSLYRLTSGLRPGRGVAIPAASDVHVVPVIDIAFYNWRGELLSGWLAVHTPQAPVIILTHGTPGNRVSMLSRAAFLYQHGYSVVLFDFQSYGLSQGAFSTLGMVESEDILAAISYVHSLPDTMYSKIGVLGLSMGATAAVLAAARSHDIVALVAESCPVDATRVPGDVPDDEARLEDEQLVEDVYGVDITEARPIDVVEKLAPYTAIFLINGTVDTTTPLSGMYALYQAAGAPRQYWVVPGAGHAQSFAVDPQGYMARVNAFFDAYFGFSGSGTN